ncbi:hypothetical protein Hte_010482 [Hypoxylon texense]
MSLIHHIKAAGWAIPSARPLVFLAHSLGGIVLKEAFTILANSHDQGMHLLSRFRGGIFFGVPSQGMATSHLLAMVQDQVNEQFVHDLSEDSEYLRSLDDRFSGLALTKDMCIHWAYETKTSPTVIRKPDGSFAREGLEKILVSKNSATRNLYASRSSELFPINENHSDMVKLREGDMIFPIIVDKLKEACQGSKHQSVDGINAVPEDPSLLWRSPVMGSQPKKWTLKGLMDSLRVPGHAYRFDTIDKNFQHTFEWIFQDEEVPLSSWLKNGQGLFWIHGKPGSGKSTLMKFIFQDRRTWELLHKFGSEATQISACFFFHDRGAVLQKSFEGLLRSILYQIIEKASAAGVELTELLAPLLRNQSKIGEPQIGLWTIDDLERCIRLLFQQNRFNLEIFLLLDALDEYDGQPEFICDTLKTLMDMTVSSSTKLKILFSSRPWEAFQKQFHRVPYVQLQDHTKDDIREYCWGMARSNEEATLTALGAVVPEVIRRADGVFLWVKLVLRELTNENLQGLGRDELIKTLDSISSDLQEYYTRTIQRIPEIYRWDAYVIFSVLASREGSIVLPIMVGALECSQKSTYDECRQCLKMLGKRMDPDYPEEVGKRGGLNMFRIHGDVFRLGDIHRLKATHPKFKKYAKRILARTGGLVELSGHNTTCLQWAHQTVNEFAQSQNFKRTILGDRDWRVQENGHTFLAKYHLANRILFAAAICLQQHELTTGRSMKAFIDSIPKEAFVNNREIDGPLALAMFGNLQLYVKDALASDPDIFKKTQEKLLSVRTLEGSSYNSGSTHLALLRVVLRNGYTLQRDSRAFEAAMRGQTYHSNEQSIFLSVRSPDFLTDLIQLIRLTRTPSMLAVWRHRGHLDDSVGAFAFYEDKASLLISHGQNPDTWFLIRPEKVMEGPLEKLLCRKRPHYVSTLHLAKTVTLASCLLEHGANVNALDTARNTPLDHLLTNCFVHLSWKRSWDHETVQAVQTIQAMRAVRAVQWRPRFYQTAQVLIEYGGVTSTSSRQIWEECISWFEADQLDVAPLRECFSRLQFKDDGKPKRKRKYLII